MIKNVKFQNNEAYLLKTHNKTVETCEKEIRRIDYAKAYTPYEKLRDDAVEGARFPSIVYAFYGYIFFHNRIPQPDDLVKNYFALYSQEIKEINPHAFLFKSRQYSTKALIARILRTYPSLVRDYHFYILLVNEKCFDSVVYSCEADICGVDITIEHRGKRYNVSLFVDTPRSNKFKKIKNEHRHNYGKNEIKVGLNLSKARKCGNIFLYSKEDVKMVKEVILG